MNKKGKERDKGNLWMRNRRRKMEREREDGRKGNDEK